MEFIQQRYFLSFKDAPAGLFSVKNFSLREALSEPYVLELMATCITPDWPILDSLGQTAVFSIKSFLPSPIDRSWYGVLRDFKQDITSADETVYRLILTPRLDLLRDSFHSRLFQNKSVPEIIEALLRHHGLIGNDFQMNLSRDYAVREYTTQYNETDYDFVRRLMEDEGLWFRFEQTEKEVIVFSDDLSHYQRGRTPDFFRPDSGLEPGLEAVRKFVVNCKSVPSKVTRHDYNYRTADVDLLSEAAAGDAPAVHGQDYRWGQHHKDPGYGQTLAQIRQEAWLAEQITAQAESNIPALAPALVLTTDQIWPEAANGWLVVEVIHQGGRDQSYENNFRAMPSDRPFRLKRVTPWPTIQGTLPARVVSPGDYRYAYLDEMGRYRVRLPFDLDTWSPAGDSRPIRLMKPYSGPNYGQHFPLHDGTEVMLGFVGGDPDRPFIYNAMHDSDHSDHVPDVWNTRNVIRTWANNKLRMEDKAGEEHVKLATEYEKTQLNLGHLVDGSREERGQGLELRTDGWGAIRAAKGIYLSADLRPEALGKQLDMREAAAALQNVVGQTKGLEQAAKYAKTAETPADDLEQLAEDLTELKEPGLVLDAPEGLAMTAEDELVLSATKSLTVSVAEEVDLSTEANLTMTSAEGLTMFAKDSGGMAAAATEDMIIQAQTDKLAVAADQDLYLRTASGEIINVAKKEVVFTCGEAYMKVKGGNIELGCPGDITAKSSTYIITGPASKDFDKELPYSGKSLELWKAAMPLMDFEAGFCHVEATKDFAGIEAAVKALTLTQSIFTDLAEPHVVLTKQEYQYVNFSVPDDDLCDLIPGTAVMFRADRMGLKPRIVVRFKEKAVVDFKLALVPNADRLEYTAGEKGRNPNFTDKLSGDYKTDAEGYCLITDLSLGSAAGNTYTIKVEVTKKDFKGEKIKEFKQGTLQSARYLWMLPVVGGNGRWEPTYSHETCLADTIAMYKDVFIHINRTRLAKQNINELEYIKEQEIENFGILSRHFNNCLNNARYPIGMKNYIFVAIMTRFVYKTEEFDVEGTVPLDGNRHKMLVDDCVVAPFNGVVDKSYLINATGVGNIKNVGVGGKLLPIRVESFNLMNRVQAVDGYSRTINPDHNGYIGCKAFEVDTAGLPTGGMLSVTIKYHGMVMVGINGAHWSAADGQSTGFFIFRGQWCDLPAGLTDRTIAGISQTASHELGHAVQMVPNGQNRMPDKPDNYYRDGDPGLAREIARHRGPHCRTGFSPAMGISPPVMGTCIMFGAGHANRNRGFCAAPANSCNKAVKKVDLIDPFTFAR